MNNNIFTIDNLLKVIPGVIIFYGFIFIDEYYDFFDIGVTSIYTIEELILSFLPIIRPLFTLTLVIMLVPIMMYFIPSYFDTQSHIDTIKVSWNEALGNKKFKTFFELILSIFKSPFVLFWIIWKALSIYSNHTDFEPITGSMFGYFVNLLFLVFVYQILKLLRLICFSEKQLPITAIFIVLAFFTGAKFFSSLGSAAAETFSPDSVVTFNYEGECIFTSEELVSLGDTKKYIILRDTTAATNYFFERDKISNLSIKN